jgi:glutamyl-tRNA synthetase
MKVVTRFAPSPTGFLHIGSARTALFNYLFAKHHGGKFLLRVEDTDVARSTIEAKDAIIESLKWLDLKWDGDIVYQSERKARHQQAAKMLIDSGNAYYCYSSQEEINEERESARQEGKSFIFHSPWRDQKLPAPANIDPVVRLKVPRTGQTVVHDLLQGDVMFHNDSLDDLVMLKSDGSPTYMLAVVVDDHEMDVTHIIRGDDHLSNTPKQQLIYQALGWPVPQMVHIPLIHGSDGAKLSKRHGALGVEGYRDMGYLPEALCNYLLRLGWSHGDQEIISRDEAIKLFDLDSLGKGAACLDFDKLRHVNAHYLRAKSDQELIGYIDDRYGSALTLESRGFVLAGMPEIRPRISLLDDLMHLASLFMVEVYPNLEDEAKTLLDKASKDFVSEIVHSINALENFDYDFLQAHFKKFASDRSLKLSDVMSIVRALVTGRVHSPSVFRIMSILGKEHIAKRIEHVFLCINA